MATADALLADLADADDGGFFTTAHDGEALIARQKVVQDTPVPSANSAAAVGFLRLSALTEEARFHDAARGVLALTGRFAGQHPTAFAHLLAAVPLLDEGVVEVTVSGDGTTTEALLAAYRSTWRPEAVVRHEPDGPEQAMVCRNSVCDLPTTDPSDAHHEPRRMTSSRRGRDDERPGRSGPGAGCPMAIVPAARTSVGTPNASSTSRSWANSPKKHAPSPASSTARSSVCTAMPASTNQ